MRLAACCILAVSWLSAQEPEIRLVRIASGVANPTDIQHAGDTSGRLFFAQQMGVIRVYRNDELLPNPFLDIRSKVSCCGERGLLGIAFPPGFEGKQYFYVHYSDLSGDTVIARYRVSPGNRDQADAGSEQVILTQRQPFANHNGGQIRFGPDGYLYIGLGDGGSGGDPQGNGQSTRSLLGKLLRIDVETDQARYRIPPDNPFAGGSSGLPEIWAYGLRNPWRFSFDRETHDLWIGDVGQDRAEEIDFAPASSRGGENYGWNLMEGLQCFRPGCSTTGLIQPVLEYTRGEGVSVTGGFVYRGQRWPALRGIYFYGDYGSGRIWGIRRENGRFSNRLILASGLNISTFGEDQAGELYLGQHGTNGAIYRVDGTGEPQTSLTISSVVNAASNAAGLVPGSAATIYGTGLTSPGIMSAPGIPLPRVLGGVRVNVNGSEAPLFAVANTNGTEQVNFQVPFEATGSSAMVAVMREAQTSANSQIPLLAAQPGIFTTNGTEAIVVRNLDNSLVTAARPLARGEYGYFYVTGLGAVDNPPQTGSAAPSAPLAVVRTQPTVTMDGVNVEVLFAGLAPGFVAVYQVNFRVPDGVAAGAHNLVISAGGVASPPARIYLQ
jgi:uncharacterized protein (TIGR03437 family)